jgi:ubiquinone/menaquinone biosynthesis C-methylase UbiE
MGRPRGKEDRLTAEPELRTAYRYAGESEWCRLGAIDKVDNLVRLCGGVPHASLLDVGAGEGSILSRLAELGFGESYTAIEVSESGLGAIRSRNLPALVDCRRFDGERIPYADASFDLAVLSHVVEHVENPRALLREAKRVARRVFVEVPLEHTLLLPRDFVADELGHINAYTSKTVRRLVQSCGLEVLEQLVTNRSRATYAYHGDRLSELKYGIKQLALRVAPGIATALWTYHGSLLCAPLRG